MTEKIKAWVQKIEEYTTKIIITKRDKYIIYISFLLISLLSAIFSKQHILGAIWFLMFLLMFLPNIDYLREKSKAFLYFGILAYWLFWVLTVYRVIVLPLLDAII